MMYIQPDECINCGLCLSVCPVAAIWEEEEVPEAERAYIAANATFFGPEVTGWGSPGGAGPQWKTGLDHPLVTAHPPSA